MKPNLSPTELNPTKSLLRQALCLLENPSMDSVIRAYWLVFKASTHLAFIRDTRK